jgi:hypothetical protein
MASKLGKFDGVIMGAFAGAIIAWPVIGTTINGWLAMLPTFAGTYSTAIYAIGIGALIGLIVEKTR